MIVSGTNRQLVLPRNNDSRLTHAYVRTPVIEAAPHEPTAESWSRSISDTIVAPASGSDHHRWLVLTKPEKIPGVQTVQGFMTPPCITAGFVQNIELLSRSKKQLSRAPLVHWDSARTATWCPVKTFINQIGRLHSGGRSTRRSARATAGHVDLTFLSPLS